MAYMAEPMDAKTKLFNDMIFSKLGLIENYDGTLAYFNTEDPSDVKLTTIFFRGCPLMFTDNPTRVLSGAIEFNPLYNKNLMKCLFDLYIYNDTKDLYLDTTTNRVYKYGITDGEENKHVIVYGKIRSPFKDDRRTCINITFNDGSSFTTNPYFNDSLKYLECIDYINQSRNTVPPDYTNIDYNEYDFTLDDFVKPKK